MCVRRQGTASDAWIVVSDLGVVGMLCCFAKRTFTGRSHRRLLELRDQNEVVSTVDEGGPRAARGCGIITWGEWQVIAGHMSSREGACESARATWERSKVVCAWALICVNWCDVEVR